MYLAGVPRSPVQRLLAPKQQTPAWKQPASRREQLANWATNKAVMAARKAIRRL